MPHTVAYTCHIKSSHYFYKGEELRKYFSMIAHAICLFSMITHAICHFSLIAHVKTGRRLFLRKKNYSCEISRLCNFLYASNNK